LPANPLGLTQLCFTALLTQRSFQIGRRDGLPYFDFIFEPNKIDWRRDVDPSWLVDPLKEGTREDVPMQYIVILYSQYAYL